MANYFGRANGPAFLATNLAGDTLFPVPSGGVTVMYSFPNMIPLPGEQVTRCIVLLWRLIEHLGNQCSADCCASVRLQPCELYIFRHTRSSPL